MQRARPCGLSMWPLSLSPPSSLVAAHVSARECVCVRTWPGGVWCWDAQRNERETPGCGARSRRSQSQASMDFRLHTRGEAHMAKDRRGAGRGFPAPAGTVWVFQKSPRATARLTTREAPWDAGMVFVLPARTHRCRGRADAMRCVGLEVTPEDKWR